MVALVQTALMVPLMFVTLPAGAIADMFDRRRIAMSGLAFSSVSAATAVDHDRVRWALTTPWVLLIFCALIGGGGRALQRLRWQASIPEQVSAARDCLLPMGLGSISYNVARSFGPALGGRDRARRSGQRRCSRLTAACFICRCWLCLLPVEAAGTSPSRLPPERIDRAIMSGVRYARHSPPIRTVMFRAFAFALCSSSSAALAPLIAKQLLHGNAGVYGILLGSTGVGAVLGALFVGDLRNRFSTEAVLRFCTAVTAAALVIVGASRSLTLDCAALLLGGGCNIVAFAMLNVSVQLSVPRWVTARALSLYSSALTGGVALGSWVWGVVAAHYDVSFAVTASGLAVAASFLLGYVTPLPRAVEEEANALVDIGHEPEVEMALTIRSGPIVIEVEYDVDPARAREFYGVMTQMEKVRRRIGAFDWSISRDVADPAVWVERYHCPTWGDYLRMRDRYTQADFEIQALADSYNRSGQGHRVRRRLERPFGSVRWQADSPDLYQGPIGYLGP